MKRKHYKYLIGDGKLPNKYWVFQHDEKFKRVKKDGFVELEGIEEDKETKNSLIWEFKTYQEALKAIDEKAYLPHIVIEDRLSGQVFESLVIVCQECGHEKYEQYEDIKFTKEKLGEDFK